MPLSPGLSLAFPSTSPLSICLSVCPAQPRVHLFIIIHVCIYLSTHISSFYFPVIPTSILPHVHLEHDCLDGSLLSVLLVSSLSGCPSAQPTSLQSTIYFSKCLYNLPAISQSLSLCLSSVSLSLSLSLFETGLGLQLRLALTCDPLVSAS